MEKGDLVYIPSNTPLRQYDDSGVFITKEIQLDKPTVGIFKRRNNEHFLPEQSEIWLGETGGQYWWVSEQNIYKQNA
jgi:hypothetical protein